ncbi:MAG: glycoside hydrolase family 10 protein, partial [Cyanobacteria bacterium]|nr:glycoside hydrolase family 10 protein [Cyanobacteriota bacterium]
KVGASRQAGLGVAFFYLESLWDLGPEPADARQAMLARLFATPAARVGRAAAPLPIQPPPPLSAPSSPPLLPPPPLRLGPGPLPALP